MSTNGRPSAPRSSAPICGRWPTGCSARRTRRRTPSKEAWLRLSLADTSEVENLRGWLTTVVARVCLNVLRSRADNVRLRKLDLAVIED
jgi:hypothetical protein